VIKRLKLFLTRAGLYTFCAKVDEEGVIRCPFCENKTEVKPTFWCRKCNVLLR
jgi:hypothetical protein